MAKEVVVKFSLDDQGVVKGMDDISKSTKDVNKNVDNTNKSLKNTEKEAKKVGKGFGNWAKILSGAGILALITLIVKAFQKVREALMGNNEVAEAWGRVMASVSAVIEVSIDKIVEAIKNIVVWFQNSEENLSNLKDSVLDFFKQFEIINEIKEFFEKLFTDPKEAIIDLGKAIYDNILRRLEAFSIMGRAIGKILKGDIKEGFKELGDGAIQLTTGIENGTEKIQNGLNKALEAGGNLIDKAKGAMVSFGAEVRAVANSASEIERAFQQLQRDQGDLLVSSAKLRREISEQREIYKDLSNDEADRLAAAEKAQQLQNQLSDEQIALKQKELEILQAKNSLSSSSIEDVLAERKLQAEIIEMETQRNNANIQHQREISRLKKAEEEREKEAFELKREREEEYREWELENIEEDEERELAKLERELEQQLQRYEDYENFEEFKVQIEEVYGKKKAEIFEKYEEERRAQQQQTHDEFMASLDEKQQMANAAMNFLSDIHTIQMNEELERVKGNVEEEEKVRKKYAKKQQRLAIAMALIDTATAAVKALATGMPQGFILAALAAAAGAAQISTIRRQKFSKGGLVKGPGSGTSDSIPAQLSNGEAVINAKSTAMFKDELSAMNQVGGGVKFSKGGIAGESNKEADMSSFSENIKDAITSIPVVVSETDISSTQRRVRVSETAGTL